MPFRKYSVSSKDREPLIEAMEQALKTAGCSVIHRPEAMEAPFRFTFETPYGERLGIVAYAFRANTVLTKNRPTDEHRFQMKYGSKDGGLHDLWQDPFGLYTTLLVGINPEQGFFVSADPVLHSPTRLFISIEFKQEHVDEILASGWHGWERPRRTRTGDPIEVLVGGRMESFLRLVRFEREVAYEDPGHRQQVAEQVGAIDVERFVQPGVFGSEVVRKARLHALAKEFDLTENEVLDLIASAPRLKMAVRGWVAEHHLEEHLRGIPGVHDCERPETEGGADIILRYKASRRISIECKNVLRRTSTDGVPRLDFQRTRASKEDPCSRYYSPKDFDIVAACLHAVSDHWTYRFAPTSSLKAHDKCPGKLAYNVRIDEGWTDDIERVLSAVART